MSHRKLSKLLPTSLRWLLIASTLLLGLHSTTPARATPDAPDGETPAATAGGIPAAPTAEGDLDISFAGFNRSNFNEFLDHSNMALAPDGKIVIAGVGDSLLTVERYSQDGSRDFSFGDLGSVTIMPPAGIQAIVPEAIAVQADGAIVIAARNRASESYDSANDFLVLRLEADGSLDDDSDNDGGFGNQGFAVTEVSNDQDIAYAISIQPDGKIVVAGFTRVGTDNNDFAVVRYTTNGQPDLSFNGSVVRVDLDGQDVAYDLALTPPDPTTGEVKIVVAGGRFINGEGEDFVLTRLNSDGTPDNSFDGNGKLATGFGGSERATAVAIEDNGYIVVLGHDVNNHDRSFLARYTTTGALDNSLDNDGKLTIPTDELVDLALQPDGKMVLLGTNTASDGNTQFALHRLNVDGSHDPTFGNQGIALHDLGSLDVGTDLALQPDGRILAASTQGRTRVIRLWQDGLTFDAGGQQTHAIVTADGAYPAGSFEHGFALAVQPDGKLLVAGDVQAYGDIDPDPDPDLYSDAVVTLFKEDGTVDTSFGVNGTARAPWAGILNSARAIAVQPDGKIVIAGTADSGNPNIDYLIARFTSDGRLDTTFGTGGHIRVDFRGNGDDKATALAIAADGKIVVVGNAWEGSHYAWGVVRLNANGTLDDNSDGDGGFGPAPDHDGRAYVDFEGANEANAVVVQPDGKIIVGGAHLGNFFIQCLLPNGQRCPNYGITGEGYNEVSMGGVDFITALALAPNGWLYAAGYADDQFAMAQFTPQGVLPICPAGQTCNHWPDGKRLVGFPNASPNVPHALAFRDDGQLVVAGCSNSHMAAIQVSTATDTDNPIYFNTNFVGPLDMDCAYGVQFVGDDQEARVVLAGFQLYEADRNIALARFDTSPYVPPVATVYELFIPLIRR